MPDPNVSPDHDPPPTPSRPPEPLTWRGRVDLLTGEERRPPPAWAAVVLVSAVLVAVLLVRAGGGGAAEIDLPVAGGPGDVGTTTTTTVPPHTLVHAAGAVRAPGVYRVPAGARVADVIDAAGGPADDADLDRLNLAAAVADGAQVYVPRHGEAVPAGAPSVPAPGEPVIVDLNTATLAELDTLPGVGPATAAAIVDERERRGGFTTVDDLLDVRGIGPARLEALRDLVRV